ncbi:MAG: agarase [Candidatus Sumerlaeia bacterium]|nr:agarase [Candidatus Sumerlaeia bacterium]
MSANPSLNRRQLLAALCTAGAAATQSGATDAGKPASPSDSGRGRFFRVGRRNGRWWFFAPDGKPFFSLGLNHIDSAPLRYTENQNLWREKYGNSIERWLKERVRPDLLAWGFNSVGWVQEVVTRGLTNHRHSRNFTFEEYQWLDLPYCHMLPFADFHQWEAETRHPDLFSQDFEHWCEYVARAECARFAEDPKLIGYFYIDCPTWIHTRKENAWKGPLFDPAKLATDAGRKQLRTLAERYYSVTYDAIRRYDKNHLILGDRYECMAPLAEEVLQAAVPFVDVLSFQHFGKVEAIRADLAKWANATEKPVLLADSCGSLPQGDGTRQDAQKYEDTLSALREIPAAVGFHLCGAYLRNRVRRRGLRDEQERPDTAAIARIARANQSMTEWVEKQNG